MPRPNRPNGHTSYETLATARRHDLPPQALIPDLEPLPDALPEPGLTHQPGFWPGITIGAGAGLLISIAVAATNTFFGAGV